MAKKENKAPRRARSLQFVEQGVIRVGGGVVSSDLPETESLATERSEPTIVRVGGGVISAGLPV